MDDETNMLYFNLEPPTLDNMTDNLLTALIHCKADKQFTDLGNFKSKGSQYLNRLTTA